MGDKMTCPGCDAHTSSVYTAYWDEKPCPHCGLSYGAMAELDEKRRTVRVSRANDEVKAIAEDALKRAGHAEAANERLQRQVDAIRAALADTEGRTP